MALKGLKVIEIAGLAPAPFCGMIFSDFGANVIRVERLGQPPLDVLHRGKRTATIDLKHDIGKSIFKKLCSNADVLIEPFRAGVMERLGLGPDQMLKLNQRLIYARLTGYGQDGQYANRAGHDINYLALSGVLSLFTVNQRPVPPMNILADFAGGGMTCALGIMMALWEREKSGLGQVVDCNMVEGVRYLSSYIWHTQQCETTKHFLWPKQGEKEANLLDGGAHFYTVYQTKDKRWLSVGSLEPQFYSELLKALGLSDNDCPQVDVDLWSELKKDFANIFAQKTLDEWVEIFKNVDACVEPVLELTETTKYGDKASFNEDGTPRPAPKLTRSPAQTKLDEPVSSEQTTADILLEHGFTREQIVLWSKSRVIDCKISGNKL